MTSLAAYASIFDTRLRPLMPTASDAARALFTLNRDCKPGGPALVYQTTVYSLKAALLEAYWRDGYCCRVTYDAWAEPKPVYGFAVVIGGVLYQWHCIEEDVDWNPACIDVPPPPGMRTPDGLDLRPAGERIATIQQYLRVKGRTR